MGIWANRLLAVLNRTNTYESQHSIVMEVSHNVDISMGFWLLILWLRFVCESAEVVLPGYILGRF